MDGIGKRGKKITKLHEISEKNINTNYIELELGITKR